MSGFVNLAPLPAGVLDAVRETPRLPISLFPDLLSADETARLLAFIDAETLIPVGLDGILDHYRSGAPVGSWRLSFLDPDFAANLFERIRNAVPDAPDGGKPVGINPLFRVIRYEPGGRLIPHYDAPYGRSRASLVLYLDGAEDGATEFLLDDRGPGNADFADRPDYDAPVLARVFPVPGAGLAFPHRVLHRGAEARVRKTIIRTDITFSEG